jgi:hypothetical protein
MSAPNAAGGGANHMSHPKRRSLPKVIVLSVIVFTCLQACRQEQGKPNQLELGNAVVSDIPIATPLAPSDVYRFSVRTRQKGKVQGAQPLSAQVMLSWPEPALDDDATTEAREGKVCALEGYLRRARFVASGELELGLSATDSESEPLVIAAVPVTDRGFQDHLATALHLTPGHALRWNDKTAPRVRLVGFPFANLRSDASSRRTWDLRPVWFVMFVAPPKDQ